MKCRKAQPKNAQEKYAIWYYYHLRIASSNYTISYNNKKDSVERCLYAEKHDHFQYPFDNQSLQDMHDGKGRFLSIPQNTGLVLSTDGVPIFKSSKGSLWPVYLMFTSIAPHLKTKVENLIVAFLWFGPTKPNMNCMLKPILQSISQLEEGIVVEQASSHAVTL